MNTSDEFQNTAKYSNTSGPVLEWVHEQCFRTSFFSGPDQITMNSREILQVNSVRFWWGPQVNLLCQYSQITQYHILQQYQIFQKAVFNWAQEHDNWITSVGLTGCLPPWTIFTLYSEPYWGQWNFCAF